VETADGHHLLWLVIDVICRFVWSKLAPFCSVLAQWLVAACSDILTSKSCIKIEYCTQACGLCLQQAYNATAVIRQMRKLAMNKE